MVNSKKREQYRRVRYEYYHAGRLLHLMGNFSGAGIMLGYAVETTMKAGLWEILTEVEQKQNKRILKSHDVGYILKECRRFGLFCDVRVSEDFLKHIHYHFQRYPSQISSVLSDAGKQNKVVANSVDWVYFYDDLIIQLDDCLFQKTLDPSVSLMCLAMRTLETRYAREILRENVFALLKFDDYATVIRQNMPECNDLRKTIGDNLSKGVLFYWGADASQVQTYEDKFALAKKYSAATFELPRWRRVDGGMEVVTP